MKGFFFKTEDFETLQESLQKDNEKFAQWVLDTESVNYMDV